MDWKMVCLATVAVGTVLSTGEAGCDKGMRRGGLSPVASAVLADPCSELEHGLSVGSMLLIIFFSVLAAYFVIGVAVRKFIGGAVGYEAIPNYAFWSDLPLLMKDGALFAFSGCRPEVVYERI
ncbi:hypothetical protein BV898_07307 [Hypsibius exemplaris]|uniref:Cation-dependent mannose-6-phosphate receptor n=1 Tax=Hypsibius exemplaris TaxID=2072580 RepID=A0A1W0WU47_HYPEX|nr:hypothetical protein BV898_07307 [Hypsibius exemplaris]